MIGRGLKRRRLSVESSDVSLSLSILPCFILYLVPTHAGKQV
jgi:hypothetical protein